MKFSINTLLGIGGVISMIASPILAFGGIKTDVEVLKTQVVSLEEVRKIVNIDHDLIIKIAAKQGIDTANAVSLSIKN